MTLQERYAGIIAYFQREMPTAESELNFENPWQLLVAVVLSAQCTDKRVNMTTPALFAAYPTPEAMAKASARKSTSDSMYWGSISRRNMLGRENSMLPHLKRISA